MQWHRISEKNDGNSCPIRGTKENKGDVISFCSGKLRRDISRRKRGDWQSVWQLEYHRSRASGNNFALSLPPFPLIGHKSSRPQRDNNSGQARLKDILNRFVSAAKNANSRFSSVFLGNHRRLLSYPFLYFTQQTESMIQFPPQTT